MDSRTDNFLKFLYAFVLRTAVALAIGGAALACGSSDNPGSCAGSKGCPCFANSTCNKKADGTWLVCGMANTCIEAPCQQGALGCGCFPGGTCSTGLVCGGADGGVSICETPPCQPGALNCGCRPDSSCSQGLVCNSGKCVSKTPCMMGDQGCACHLDGMCNTIMLSCSPAGLCEVPSCPLGSDGCDCNPDGACNAGTIGSLACVNGKCAQCTAAGCSVAGIKAPAKPNCYTPCKSGFVDPGTNTFRDCSADGLMLGCVGGQTCSQGTCIGDGGMPPVCTLETDCADFQNCVAGRCVAACDYTTDCPAGLSCYRHACRQPCTGASQTCAGKSACVLVDSSNGYCMPQRTPDPVPVTAVTGGFTVDRVSVSFSNTHPSDAITVTNGGPSDDTYTLAKVEHTELSVAQTPLPRCPSTTCASAMTWLGMSAPNVAETTGQTLAFTVLAGESAKVNLTHAGDAQSGGSPLSRWEGRLQLASSKFGSRTIQLSYVSKPEGRWSGKMVYFANFGDQNLAAWVSGDRFDSNRINAVSNAFIKKWGDYRLAQISFDEWQAVAQATLDGSWDYASVKRSCKAVACYPYVDPMPQNDPGIRTYTDSSYFPIPTGAAELPIAMDLTSMGAPANTLIGRIVSSESLQYAGDPQITIVFASDPTATPCGHMGLAGECRTFVQSLSASVALGGRFLSTSGGMNSNNQPTGDPDCSIAATAGVFDAHKVPWLVPGFTADTFIGANNLRYYGECRSHAVPWSQMDPATFATNASLAGSNPIPDGRTRARTIELVDGALINQDSLVLIVKEHFDGAFLGTGDSAGFSAYAYVLLKRSPVELDAKMYVGNAPATSTAVAPGLLATGCNQALLDKVFAPTKGTVLVAANAATVANAVVGGQAPVQAANPLAPSIDGSGEVAHYLCHQTGLFDGGPQDDGTASAVKQPCPVGSGVTYFTLSGYVSPPTNTVSLYLSGEACQKDASCQNTLNAWVSNTKFYVRTNPVWVCHDRNQAYCDANRNDLRTTKDFYPALAGSPIFVPLKSAVDSAFRYRTQFRSRSGTGIGFAPQICARTPPTPSNPNGDVSNAIPYCYDPIAIEEIRSRVDCALSLYTNQGPLGLNAIPQGATTTTAAMLKTYLTPNFGFEQLPGPPPVVKDGFERLNAELLVMGGDDAYTKAFASRFDLANSSVLAFQGSLFEPNGIDLSGGAGFEMYNLYLATEYYQMALDRFYRLTPLILKDGTPLQDIITVDTVDTYFARLIRASVQKSKAWSEIAKRYQNFNRPDLARAAVQRAYVATYLEATVFSRMLLGVLSVTDPAKQADIQHAVDNAQRTFRSALLDMRDVWSSITDEINFFGFAPDFVPFPALEPGDVNAFEKLFNNAKTFAAVAAIKEDAALAANKSYETDSAQFQAQLVSLRNNYENQLSDLCGTFKGSDGNIYPAIPKYASLDPLTQTLVNPCGFAGNGKIHDARGEVDLAMADMREATTAIDDVIAQIDIEHQRVQAQCNEIFTEADYVWQSANKTNTLQNVINGTRLVVDTMMRAEQHAKDLADFANCDVGVATSCPGAAVAAAGLAAALGGMDAVIDVSQLGILGVQSDIADIQASTARWQTKQQCQFALIDSNAKTKTLALEIEGKQLEALKAEYRLKLATSQVLAQINQSTRLLAQEAEAEQLSIDVEAARNDPNVRIYKNDSIETADRTFYSAVQAAYEATKVFEYYTSQSYAHDNDLFLVRMVGHGDISLDQYLGGLSDAYHQFQQSFGNPDNRVEIYSLRDDVLGIPHIDEHGKTLDQGERIVRFRAALKDPLRLDANGYLTCPFATALSRLSPLTRDHKITKIEAEIIGSDVGDAVGRVYLRQSGTGTVYNLGSDKAYYRLPERTAVMNPFFNGVRVFTPDVYLSDRMRDRPFANSRWEIVINQKDEHANQDINLSSLTDVRLYVYYTDFTKN